ncbi:hypothetical protein [Vibrio lentus]|nr:hypothetical protein [Vibrio lentus]
MSSLLLILTYDAVRFLEVDVRVGAFDALTFRSGHFSEKFLNEASS